MSRSARSLTATCSASPAARISYLCKMKGFFPRLTRRCSVPRENAFSKSRRLLTSGAVTVIRVDRSGIAAIVKGDTEGLHRVTWEGRWACDCSSLGVCSHALAVAAVAAPPGEWLAGADLLAT